jgi:hypothetical protein
LRAAPSARLSASLRSGASPNFTFNAFAIILRATEAFVFGLALGGRKSNSETSPLSVSLVSSHRAHLASLPSVLGAPSSSNFFASASLANTHTALVFVPHAIFTAFASSLSTIARSISRVFVVGRSPSRTTTCAVDVVAFDALATSSVPTRVARSSTASRASSYRVAA